MVHLVVDQPEGLRHIEVWGSRAQWQQFQQERVVPAVRETLAAARRPAPPVPPATRELDVVDVWLGA